MQLSDSFCQASCSSLKPWPWNRVLIILLDGYKDGKYIPKQPVNMELKA